MRTLKILYGLGSLLIGILFVGLLHTCGYGQERHRSSHWTYHFIPNRVYLYHTRYRARVSRLSTQGERYRDVTTEADAEVSVDTVYPDGSARIYVRIGNIKEDANGTLSMSRRILIPISDNLIGKDGSYIEGAIIQEDTARQESKRLGKKSVIGDIIPIGDKTALRRSFQTILNYLPERDTVYDGYEFADTSSRTNEDLTNEFDRHLPGKKEAVVSTNTRTITSTTVRKYSVSLDESVDNIPCWKVTCEETESGKRDQFEFTEEKTTKSLYENTTSMPVEEHMRGERHEGGAYWRFYYDLKLIGPKWGE